MRHERIDSDGVIVNPQVIAAIEAVGFQAGRYAPSLGLHIDLRSRLYALLEVKRGLGKSFGFNEPLPEYGLSVASEWCFAVDSDGERAERFRHVRSVKVLGRELDDHIERVRGWQARLDINSTIDQRQVWSGEFRRYLKEWPLRRVFEHFGYARLPAKGDVWSEMLAQGSAEARKAELVQRLSNELAVAVAKGWYLVLDTLTIDPRREDEFLAHPTAVRDHVRRVGRLVNKALGRPAGAPYDDVFRYFAVPEYGKTGTARLHFHVVYFMKALPLGTVDPNRGRQVRNRREVGTLKVWEWGWCAPISMRFSGDAFSKAGWLWPVDKKGIPLESKPPLAVARYVSKYVNKSEKERSRWLRNKSQESRKAFRVRMTRSFGLTFDLSRLSLPVLLEVSCLHHSVTSNARLLRRLSLRQMSLRLAGLSIADFLGLMPPRTPLLERLRGLTAMTPGLNLRSFADTQILRLRARDISSECAEFIASLPTLETGRVPVSAK